MLPHTAGFQEELVEGIEEREGGKDRGCSCGTALKISSVIPYFSWIGLSNKPPNCNLNVSVDQLLKDTLTW